MPPFPSNINNNPNPGFSPGQNNTGGVSRPRWNTGNPNWGQQTQGQAAPQYNPNNSGSLGQRVTSAYFQANPASSPQTGGGWGINRGGLSGFNRMQGQDWNQPQYMGGTPNFDESTGTYRQPPPQPETAPYNTPNAGMSPTMDIDPNWTASPEQLAARAEAGGNNHALTPAGTAPPQNTNPLSQAGHARATTRGNGSVTPPGGATVAPSVNVPATSVNTPPQQTGPTNPLFNNSNQAGQDRNNFIMNSLGASGGGDVSSAVAKAFGGSVSQQPGMQFGSGQTAPLSLLNIPGITDGPQGAKQISDMFASDPTGAITYLKAMGAQLPPELDALAGPISPNNVKAAPGRQMPGQTVQEMIMAGQLPPEKLQEMASQGIIVDPNEWGQQQQGAFMNRFMQGRDAFGGMEQQQNPMSQPGNLSGLAQSLNQQQGQQPYSGNAQSTRGLFYPQFY